ncbi:MAG: RecQ family ATP-dependent DNA helicase [Candidatus Omnitrophica bacterium]|nr:RecQ family ATP-dependent DNA helicase [Candidatus Omnitrophota bacterium]MBU4478634.1 RecQ family ATP-dependent DNA helicase [Candidatus Omnitrophota bacterium]
MKTECTDRKQGLELLRKAIGQPSAEFRAGQWEAIDSLINHKKRLLVVQRTGWGKSLVYFVATRVLRNRGAGPTLIVSPLLALMRNQIQAAERLGIKALTINSTNKEDWPRLAKEILDDKADIILVSPERLANDEFVSDLLIPVSNRVGLLVVDEAHCISDWGHDFRPDYRRLVRVLQYMPQNISILGTTATANNRVLADIIAQLGDLEILRGGLMRETLELQALRLPDQASRLAWLAEYVPKMPGTGIIYTLTKRDTEIVANWLKSKGIEACAYYSGIESEAFEDSNAYREHLETLLLENKIKVLVATTALGMGYDKPDLGFVIHFQAPGSVVAYYQQVGRAGRAINRAFGILLSGREDDDILEYFRDEAFPDERLVNIILEALSSSDGLTIGKLQEVVNLRRGQIERVLKFLSVENPSPVFKRNSVWERTAVKYQMDHERIGRLTQQRVQEWAEVQSYFETKECLMVFLARSLDDKTTRPCGKCSNCLGRPILSTKCDLDLEKNAQRFLRNSELPLQCKVRIPANAFPVYGFKGNMPSELRADEGRVLSRWGDAGWGRIVADNKHDGFLSDELVCAVYELYVERWNPETKPAWVTCVPSFNHPKLVPDFSERLAKMLKVPFLPVVVKLRKNEPQKLQQNTFYQCRNLDGVFGIHGEVPAGNVLLVDDIVDSIWTMTVVSALLRQAGSGPVLPVALATTRHGD